MQLVLIRIFLLNRFVLGRRPNRLHQEIVTLKQKVHDDSVNLNRRCVEIHELKKEVNSWRDKYKEQDHELHTTKTERNLFAKNLSEAKVGSVTSTR